MESPIVVGRHDGSRTVGDGGDGLERGRGKHGHKGCAQTDFAYIETDFLFYLFHACQIVKG